MLYHKNIKMMEERELEKRVNVAWCYGDLRRAMRHTRAMLNVDDLFIACRGFDVNHVSVDPLGSKKVSIYCASNESELRVECVDIDLFLGRTRAARPDADVVLYIAGAVYRITGIEYNGVDTINLLTV